MAQILDFRFYRATRLLKDSALEMENVHEGVNTLSENFDVLHTQIKQTHKQLSGFQEELQEFQDECQRSMDFNRRCQRVIDQADMDEMMRLRDRVLKKYAIS